MKRFIALVLTLVFVLASCATVGLKITRPNYCVGKPSVIYEVFEAAQIDPKTVNGLLLTANYVALESGLYDAKKALLGLSALEVLLGQNVSYYTMMQTFMEHFGFLRNTKAATFVAFIVPMLPSLSSQNLLSDCDCALIMKMIDDQRAMVVKFAGV